MKRALALVTDAYGGRGGIAQAARDIIAALAACEEISMVEVLPRQTLDPIFELPAKVCQLPPSAGRLRYIVRSIQRVWTERPNIVFCNHVYMAPLAALIAYLVGARFMVQLHGIEIWAEPTKLQRRALEAADLLICVSRDTRSRALTHCDIRPERAVVLNNTFDSRFTPGPRAVARNQFGLKDEFVLLIIGRLDARERYKGHDRVIAALPQLVHLKRRPILFLIAGDGDDRPRLEAEAAAAGVYENVRFLGQVPAENLPDLYRAADLFVLPSTGEGFGIVFIEAMACGTPALGLAAGGAPDALGDGDLGFMVQPDQDLARAIGELIAEPHRSGNDTAASVHNRFGNTAFNSRVANLVARIAI